jgi:hypothetical protein
MSKAVRVRRRLGEKSPLLREGPATGVYSLRSGAVGRQVTGGSERGPRSDAPHIWISSSTRRLESLYFDTNAFSSSVVRSSRLRARSSFLRRLEGTRAGRECHRANHCVALPATTTVCPGPCLAGASPRRGRTHITESPEKPGSIHPTAGQADWSARRHRSSEVAPAGAAVPACGTQANEDLSQYPGCRSVRAP